MSRRDDNQRSVQEVGADHLRLDKWLWHARFFKSRSQATEATTGGRVHVNGERAKPSRDIKIGDRLEISRDELRFEVVVRSIPVRRGPAAEAQLCYEETTASVTSREKLREQQRYVAPAPSYKPNKQQRRALRGLKGH